MNQILMAIIYGIVSLLSLLVLFILWHCFINPIGPNARCRKWKTLSFHDGESIELFSVDENMTPGMVKKYLEPRGRTIASTVFLNDPRKISEFPENTRVATENELGGITIIERQENTHRRSVEPNETFYDCVVAVTMVVPIEDVRFVDIFV